MREHRTESLMCEVPLFKKNFLDSRELYWGPLSLNNTLGMSCHANILLIWVIAVSDEAFGSWASSKYLLV